MSFTLAWVRAMDFAMDFTRLSSYLCIDACTYLDIEQGQLVDSPLELVLSHA